MDLGTIIFSGSLLLLLAAFSPTFLEVLRKGNAADPLRREIEEENERKRQQVKEKSNGPYTIKQ